MVQNNLPTQSSFNKLLDFLFKDYPAWLWKNPNIFKFFLFPFLFVYKVFDVFISAKGDHRYVKMRILFASLLSVVLVFIISNTFYYQNLNKFNLDNNNEKSSSLDDTLKAVKYANDSGKASSANINNSFSFNDLNKYLLPGFLGIIVLLMWISVFSKRKTPHFQECESMVGQSKKSNYNKN